MKKLITFLAFLCLAVGTTSAKSFLKNLGNNLFTKVENTVDNKMDNPEGNYAKIDTKKLEYTIPYIPVEKRSTILPKHNICSIAPAAESSDYFITGSGALRLQAS
ncbi:MAG: hypothetical protein IJL42_09185, partial [Bacteroidales bacterium]|nr:hypothetical protein [Bacteroidales bacterium]